MAVGLYTVPRCGDVNHHVEDTEDTEDIGATLGRYRMERVRFPVNNWVAEHLCLLMAYRDGRPYRRLDMESQCATK